ncbi:MAG: GNAT family N-acetyltransferase [Flavobacteriales bacterium]
MQKIIRTIGTNADFQHLVTLLDAELRQRDGDEHAFYAQFNQSVFLQHVVLLYDGDDALGCGALKPYSPGTVEVKRMFVKDAHRGKGMATTILQELEAWAVEEGFDTCVLETGIKQPEAIALYTKHGYDVIANYDQYAEVGNSVCFSKKIGMRV